MTKKHAFPRTTKSDSRGATDEIVAGYQWGEPYPDEPSFRVECAGGRLEINAAMPNYSSAERPSDLIRQYELARQAQRRAKGFSKNAPHIRFANATSDEELIEFVRQFGPVVASTVADRPSHGIVEVPGSEGRVSFEWPIYAVQDLVELRNEQRIYKAALSLVLELRKPEKVYDEVSASDNIAEIAQLTRAWPLQWRRERKARRNVPLWKVRSGMIELICAMKQRKPREILPPQLDARIVLCQLLNVFPSFVFPNLPAMHSYLYFGIRPLLYSLLRREFLHTFNTAVCINPSCRNFYEIERAAQQYCSPECSRQHRQRSYWESRGRRLRIERNARQQIGERVR